MSRSRSSSSAAPSHWRWVSRPSSRSRACGPLQQRCSRAAALEAWVDRDDRARPTHDAVTDDPAVEFGEPRVARHVDLAARAIPGAGPHACSQAHRCRRCHARRAPRARRRRRRAPAPGVPSRLCRVGEQRVDEPVDVVALSLDMRLKVSLSQGLARHRADAHEPCGILQLGARRIKEEADGR